MTSERPAPPPSPSRRARRPTKTAAFGSGRRESHDASGFYGRFVDPEISADETVVAPVRLDEIVPGDARDLLEGDRYVVDNSVALMVTSPPYFAGKEYEEALGQGHIPDSYKSYVKMLRDVFALVKQKLEPGGRIAVNVANLGRKPYRSLSADVMRILEDDLKLLIRGEVVWQKALGAGGSVAWGSYQSAKNPVLRDVTERVIVASKGRFDRAVDRPVRAARGLPHEVSIDADRFMDATIDVWEIPPESATRVGHPAPFPVELPHVLIDLYTYVGDLVLDPFMGSGTTAVAAVRSGRRFFGFDTDPAYVDAALARVARERDALAAAGRLVPAVRLGGRNDEAADPGDPVASAVRDGRKAKEVAELLLREAGFADVRRNVKLASGLSVDFGVRDRSGAEWFVDVTSAFTSIRSGLRRTDAVVKAIGKAALLDPGQPYLLLSTDAPPAGSPAERALRAAQARGVVFDALDLSAGVTRTRLAAYAGGRAERPRSVYPRAAARG